ncbi:MAG: protein kinase domain-containing protein, partial [Nannocystaceae bacterium]
MTTTTADLITEQVTAAYTPSPRQLPSSLGGYTLGPVLGIGGHAKVFAATSEDSRYAVKVLEKRGSLERFLWEYQVLERVNSPHIVHVYTCDLSPVPFYVMDLITGSTLHAYRRSQGGLLPIPEVLSIARQICAGLDALHRVGVIHRDLCPGNIMRDEQGHIMLIDLGIA